MSEKPEKSEKIVPVLAGIIPYACIFAALAALAFLFLLGRSDLALKSLFILAPVVAAAIVIIVRPRWVAPDKTKAAPGEKEELQPAGSSAAGILPRIDMGLQSFRQLVLLFVFLFIAGIYLLIVYDARPLFYFFLVGGMAALIFIEILAAGEAHSGRRVVILAQTVLLSASLIFGETLRLPLYTGYGDIISHMYSINSILENGRITNIFLVNYMNWPGLHIFGAAGNLLSGISLQSSYFIFNGLFFLVSIPIVYLLVGKLTKNPHLPLTAALIFALNRETLFNGMYMITRVMAFILCFAILYLLVRSRQDLKVRALALFLVLPLVITHHTTLLHFTGILFALAVIEIVLYRPPRHIGLNFVTFFAVAYLGYWGFIGLGFFENPFASQTIVQAPMPVVPQPLLFTFTTNIDTTIIVFLAVLGIVSLLRARRESYAMGTVFALFSLGALVVYSPTVGSFLSTAFLSTRLELLVTPFIAFVTAGGLALITARLNPGRPRSGFPLWAAFGAFIVFVLVSSALLIQGSFTDVNIKSVLGSENRQYFSVSELDSFSFAAEYGRDQYFYGDYSTEVYLKRSMDLKVKENFEMFTPQSINGTNCMVLRTNELQTRGQLGFTVEAPGGTTEQDFVYWPSQGIDLRQLWEQQNKIFDNGSVEIFIKKQ
jgi:hypothetical protein